MICSFGISSQLKAGGTVIGNGGDPVFEFLEAARVSMIETLKVIANDPKEQAVLCRQEPLDLVQSDFCRNYVLAVLPDMLKLSQGLKKTLFVLRDHPLLVQGPDGQPMVVAARTELGPQGPIEFNRDAVKTLLPTQVLFLMSHEFLHKASFEGRFINDNSSEGPFATGRDLLDSVATYVVSLARKKGKIGSQFGIRDIFDCTVNLDHSQFGARISSSRLFQAPDLMSYETSIGKNPSDGTIYVPEANNSNILLKFVIQEPNNCGDASNFRNTTVQIVRRKLKQNGDYEDQVVSNTNLSRNPMCPGSDTGLEISWQNIKFNCKYYGSEGTTSSVFSTRYFSKRK